MVLIFARLLCRLDYIIQRAGFPGASDSKESTYNVGAAAAAAAKSLQSCPTLCNPIDGSPPGPTIPGILQARTLEWVAISSSNAWKWKVKVNSLNRVQLLATPWTLSDPMDCSLPGSSIHGIFQARVLEWVAIAFSDNVGELHSILGMEDPLEKGMLTHSSILTWKTPQTEEHGMLSP